MSGGRDWTTGEAKRFREMREAGAPTAVIALELGRTRDALYSFARYCPAERKPPIPPQPKERPDCYWSPEELATLREMANDGASSRDIAEATGRSLSAIRCKSSNLNIRLTNRGGNSIYRLEHESEHFKKNAIEGSARLLDAMLALAA